MSVLEPWVVIRHIYNQCPLFYEQRKKELALSHSEWAKALGGAGDYQVTRLLKPDGPVPGLFLKRFEARRPAIADLLGLPETIFECETIVQLQQIVDAQTAFLKNKAGPRDVFIELTAQAIDLMQFSLHKKERAAVDELLGFIDRGGRPILSWQDDALSGASFLVHAAAAARAGTPRRMFLLRPCPSGTAETDPIDRELTYDVALARLTETMGLTADGSGIMRRLAEKIVREEATVFLANFDLRTRKASRAGADAVLNFLEQFRSLNSRQRKSAPIPIVAIGSINEPSLDGIWEPINLRRTLGLNEAEAGLFFEQQFQRFVAWRGERAVDSLDARKRRARWHYNTYYNDRLVWPAKVRLRAFFASNIANKSYFDPTAGFDRLSGVPRSKLPLDVAAFARNIEIEIDGIATDGRRQNFRALAWCSTALYWLTSDAAEALGQTSRPTTPGEPTPPSMSLDAFKTRVEEPLKRLITIRGFPDESRQKYMAGLAVKALTQDKWRKSNSSERSLTHFRLAARLYKLKDDRNALAREFPLSPNWGLSRIHFLAQSLRHLMRSCEGADLSSFTGPDTDQRRISAFPNPPSGRPASTNPYEVVNFCFSRLYWDEINANDAPDAVNGRLLARQHGAFELTNELLQLMSDDYELGRPHPALIGDNVPRYYREVAYAQLDGGNLLAAKAAIEKLLNYFSSKPLQRIRHELDLMIVLILMGHYQDARACLRRAEELSESLPPDDDGKQLALGHRLLRRKAHILYMEGKPAEALAIYRELPERYLSRDSAHRYIAALGASRGDQTINLALTLCLKNLFHSTSNGLHHEELGFRISLGHLFRKIDRLDAAEACLDQAYKDILQFGCSERSLLAFLLEAGRVVMSMGTYARAYACYLRPCFDRSFAKGFDRTAHTAYTKAASCLINMRSSASASPAEWQANLSALLEPKGAYFAEASEPAHDPLFSFDMVSPAAWEPRLKDIEAIDAELLDLNSKMTKSAEARKMPE